MPRRLLWFAFLALLVPVAGRAAEPINATLFGRRAVQGFDVVAYFEDGKPAQGREDLSFQWKGATWLFATPEHRDQFKAAPERYAPRYGGYCAYAMARGEKVGIDPKAWSIVEGKLYLNYDLDVKKKWEVDRDGYISKADGKWAALAR